MATLHNHDLRKWARNWGQRAPEESDHHRSCWYHQLGPFHCTVSTGYAVHNRRSWNVLAQPVVLQKITGYYGDVKNEFEVCSDWLFSTVTQCSQFELVTELLSVEVPSQFLQMNWRYSEVLDWLFSSFPGIGLGFFDSRDPGGYWKHVCN